MGKGNFENLIQNKDRTPEERRKSATKAGIASGVARQRKRLLQQALQKALDGKYEVGDPKKEEVKSLGGYEAMAISMVKEAIRGNVQAFKEIRDTIGEKPKDTLAFENDDLTGIKIEFVDKSKPKRGDEIDPKIVGEYTPPNNVDDEG